MTQSVVPFPVGGGLDLITPALSLNPGRAVAALNYEPVLSGYKRVDGYERYDGRLAPSTARVVALRYQMGNNALGTVQPGDRVTQSTGGARPSADGFALAPAEIVDGSFALGTAMGRLFVVVVDGVFTDARAILTPDAAATQMGAPETTLNLTPTAEAEMLRVAQDCLRSNILPVPGTGPVRGIWFSNGRAYAVRDSEDGTAGVPYYSELNNNAQVGNLTIGGVEITIAGEPITLLTVGDGWTPAINERVLRFDDGSIEPKEGDTISQDGQGSAEVRRVVLDPGSSPWSSGNASGRVYVIGQTGAFVAGPAKVNGFTGLAAAGDSVESAFPPGGRYSFITENFYGQANQERVYGVNGVGPAFEYDGTAIVEISTGVNPDRPTRIAEHKRSLFLSYPGGSVVGSQIGEPRQFDGTLGAVELATGDEITDFLPVQNALAILCASSVQMLYGNDKDDYQLDQLTDEAGALPWTAQRIGQAVYLDNRGLRDLSATSAYGNFKNGTLSGDIEPLLADLRRDSVNPTASLIVRSKSQYWLFFSNGTALVFLFGRKVVEAMPVNLGVNVFCAASVEDNGVERIFIGGEDGFVYELNRGVSFDGRAIEYYIRFPYYNFRSPQQQKRAHKVTVDLEAQGLVTLDVSVDVELGAQPGEPPQRLMVTPGGGAVDSLGGNELYFASQIETVAEAYLGIVGRNFSLKISGSSATEEAHTLTGVTYHISPRGTRR